MPLLRRPHLAQAFLALCTLATSQLAQAVVLDFEDMACARTQPVCDAGQHYASKGYALSYTPDPDDGQPLGFHVVGRLWAPNGGGSIAMLANSCGATTTLMARQGKPFSVLTMDLAEANGDSPSSVAFTGIKTDGTPVRWSLSLDGRPGWQRVVLPSAFYNLKSLSWLQGDCLNNKSHMFDNILVVPGVSAK